MGVCLPKGEKLLDECGVWRCKNGHDKDEVGLVSGGCRKCFYIQQNERKRLRRRQNPNFTGDPDVIPNLVAVRRQLGMSQSQLARLCGLHRNTISRIELKGDAVSYAVRRKILSALAPILAKRREYGY